MYQKQIEKSIERAKKTWVSSNQKSYTTIQGIVKPCLIHERNSMIMASETDLSDRSSSKRLRVYKTK